MGDVVNLNKFRKQRARTEAERTAEQNRLKHGRTKAERERDRDGQVRLIRRLDQHHLGSGDDSAGPPSEADTDD